MNDFDSARTEQHQDDENASPDTLIEADALIEEVSIDGMCGVY
ncbi:mycofactocin precursor MftA [Streptomyces sp. NPDC086080]